MHIITLLKTKIRHLRDKRQYKETIKKRNLHRFIKFVLAIKERSPFYNQIIRKYRIDPYSCSPHDFPVMTKLDVIKHFDRIVTDPRIKKEALLQFIDASKNPLDLYLNRYYVLHSSGTSGEKSLFVYSEKDFGRGIAHGMGLVGISLPPKRRRIAYFGATEGHYAGVTMVSISKRTVPKLIFQTKTFEINQPIEGIINNLNSFRPHVVIGYTTALKILAKKQNEGSLDIKPTVVESCGETIYLSDKEFIESAFRCKLLNIYASTEFLYMGISKPEYNGMYLLENDLIFELNKDHTCVTNLFNYTMPLIRYRIDDTLIPVADKNRILPFTKVHEVIGRREHALVFKNRYGHDDFISPHILDQLNVHGVYRFQIKLIDKQSFVVMVILKEDLNKVHKKEVFDRIRLQFTSILNEKKMENVAFNIQETSELPLDPVTRKFELVVKS